MVGGFYSVNREASMAANKLYPHTFFQNKSSWSPHKTGYIESTESLPPWHISPVPVPQEGRLLRQEVELGFIPIFLHEDIQRADKVMDRFLLTGAL